MLAHVGGAAQDGDTALNEAARNGHADCARLLLNAGADKEAKNNVRSSTGAGVCRDEGVGSGEWANAVDGMWCGVGRLVTCISAFSFYFRPFLRFGFGAFRAPNRVNKSCFSVLRFGVVSCIIGSD